MEKQKFTGYLKLVFLCIFTNISQGFFKDFRICELMILGLILMIFGKGKKICAKMDIFFVRRRRRQNYMKLQGME